MRRSPSLCIFPRGSHRITPHCRLDMRSFNPVPPNKKTFSIVICTGDNADLPEGRGCLRTFFEKIYESIMQVDLLAVVFSGGEPLTMWFNTRCASDHMLTTRRTLTMCSTRDELWLCGSRRIEPLVMCSPRDCQSHMLTRRCASGYMLTTQ